MHRLPGMRKTNPIRAKYAIRYGNDEGYAMSGDAIYVCFFCEPGQ